MPTTSTAAAAPRSDCPPWAVKLLIGWLVGLASFVALHVVFNPLGDLRESVIELNLAVAGVSAVVDRVSQRQATSLVAIEDLTDELRNVREAMIRSGLEIKPSK